jgi:hypothetical protein
MWWDIQASRVTCLDYRKFRKSYHETVDDSSANYDNIVSDKAIPLTIHSGSTELEISHVRKNRPDLNPDR